MTMFYFSSAKGDGNRRRPVRPDHHDGLRGPPLPDRLGGQPAEVKADPAFQLLGIFLQGVFLKIIPAGILTYTSMKTGFQG